MARPVPQSSTILRVAAAWGTTVLAAKNLLAGESLLLGDEPGSILAMPDGISASPMPVRAVASGWELDARGVSSGLLLLRGREENPVRFGGAPVPIVPGDWGLLQYGLFSVFFQFAEAPPPLPDKKRRDLLVMLAVVSSFVLHVGFFGLVRALTTPPPIPKPAELSNPDELAARFGVQRAFIEEPPPVAAGPSQSGGTGVKDPGAQDTKKQGGGKKIAGAEGKLGKNDKEDRTELPGEIKSGLGGMSDALSGDTGEEIKHTLGTISSVAAALGGLNSQNIVLGSGSGTGLKGAGPGGGGTGPGGVPFGSGTLNTGWGPGNGGGFGTGAGGPGGAGRGGNGLGGTGSGTGSGNGTGEHQVAVSAAGGSGTRGLSQEQIRRVVMAHLGALRACYESEVERNPGLKGGVTVNWQIAPEGTVTGSSVGSSTLNNPRVEGCVVRQVKGWKFPTSGAPSSVAWPFKFGVGG